MTRKRGGQFALKVKAMMSENQKSNTNDPSPVNGEDQGGSGGGSTTTIGGGVPTIRDTRMEERAIRQRWPISDKTRQKVIERMEQILECRPAKRREKIAAARAIIAAESQNQSDDLKQIADKVDVRHSGSVNLTVIEDEDWYGNVEKIRDNGSSNGDASETTGPSAPDSDLTESVQGLGVRPSLGQNGNGSSGNGSRTR